MPLFFENSQCLGILRIHLKLFTEKVLADDSSEVCEDLKGFDSSFTFSCYDGFACYTRALS